MNYLLNNSWGSDTEVIFKLSLGFGSLTEYITLFGGVRFLSWGIGELSPRQQALPELSAVLRALVREVSNRQCAMNRFLTPVRCLCHWLSTSQQVSDSEHLEKYTGGSVVFPHSSPLPSPHPLQCFSLCFNRVRKSSVCFYRSCYIHLI